MTKDFTAGVMIFIEQFRARWTWSIGMLESCQCRRLLPKSWSLPFSGFHLQWPLLRMSPTAGDETSRGRNPSPRHFRSSCCRCVRCSEHTYSDHSWGCLPQPGMKRQGEGILRMEDAGTWEDDDTDSQDSNIPIDHGHLAWNCSIKIFGKMLGNVIPEDHSLQAQKSLLIYNSYLIHANVDLNWNIMEYQKTFNKCCFFKIFIPPRYFQLEVEYEVTNAKFLFVTDQDFYHKQFSRIELKIHNRT